MKTFKYVITSDEQIHARPAKELVALAKKYTSEIKIEKGGKQVKMNSLILIMSLAIKKGDTITVSANGDDEDAAIAEVETYLKANL